jgi:hypothetical protein
LWRGAAGAFFPRDMKIWLDDIREGAGGLDALLSVPTK